MDYVYKFLSCQGSLTVYDLPNTLGNLNPSFIYKLEFIRTFESIDKFGKYSFFILKDMCESKKVTYI